MREKVSNLIDELEFLKNHRHDVRVDLINFVRDNIQLFPQNFSTGRLGHQRNRRSNLIEKIQRNHMGDICDKELIKDSRIILNNIQ